MQTDYLVLKVTHKKALPAQELFRRLRLCATAPYQGCAIGAAALQAIQAQHPLVYDTLPHRQIHAREVAQPVPPNSTRDKEERNALLSQLPVAAFIATRRTNP